MSSIAAIRAIEVEERESLLAQRCLEANAMAVDLLQQFSSEATVTRSPHRSKANQKLHNIDKTWQRLIFGSQEKHYISPFLETLVFRLTALEQLRRRYIMEEELESFHQFLEKEKNGRRVVVGLDPLRRALTRWVRRRRAKHELAARLYSKIGRLEGISRRDILMLQSRKQIEMFIKAVEYEEFIWRQALCCIEIRFGLLFAQAAVLLHHSSSCEYVANNKQNGWLAKIFRLRETEARKSFEAQSLNTLISLRTQAFLADVENNERLARDRICVEQVVAIGRLGKIYSNVMAFYDRREVEVEETLVRDELWLAAVREVKAQVSKLNLGEI